MLVRQDSRQLVKRTVQSGSTPFVTTASTDHTDGTWVNNQIYAGEFYLNMKDKRIWVGYDDIDGVGIMELITYSGGTKMVFEEGIIPNSIQSINDAEPNYVNAETSFAMGRGNIIESEAGEEVIIIFGSNNIITGGSINHIIGVSNELNGSQSNIFGFQNIIKSGQTIDVFGNGIYVTGGTYSRIFGNDNILNLSGSSYVNIFGMDINQDSQITNSSYINLNSSFLGTSGVDFNISNSNYIDYFGFSPDEFVIDTCDGVIIKNYDEFLLNLSNSNTIDVTNIGGNNVEILNSNIIKIFGNNTIDMNNVSSIDIFGLNPTNITDSTYIRIFGNNTNTTYEQNLNYIDVFGNDNEVKTNTSHSRIFGSGNTVYSATSVDISGFDGSATRNGEQVRSITTSGQKGSVFYWGTTTTNSTTELGLNGTSNVSNNRFVIEEGSSYRVAFSVVAISNSGETKEYEGKCLIKTYTGTTTMVGSPTITNSFGDAGLSTADFLLDAQSNYLRVRVTGVNSRTIKWMITADYVKVHNNSNN